MHPSSFSGRARLLLLAVFLLMPAAVSLPLPASAANACFCKPHRSGAPCGDGTTIMMKNRMVVTDAPGVSLWAEGTVPIASNAECTDECGTHLQGFTVGYQDENSSICASKIVGVNSCVRLQSADDPACGTPRYCFCAFKDGATETGGSASCGGRMWRNQSGDGTGSAGAATCQASCTAFLGRPAAQGTDYLSTLSASKDVCYYEKTSGGGCDSSIYNYGESWVNFARSPYCVTTLADPDACNAQARATQCKPRWCSCKYPDTFAATACRAKSVDGGWVSTEAACTERCKAQGLGFYKTFDDDKTSCNYLDSSVHPTDPQHDHCAAATDPERPDCANVDAASAVVQGAQDAAMQGAKKGTVLGLNLPLSDVSLPVLIGRVIDRILSVIGALALAFFVWGGLVWMTASGDPKKVDQGKGIIVAALSGLVAIFASYALVNMIINAVSN